MSVGVYGCYGFLWVFMSFWVFSWCVWVLMGVVGVYGYSEEFMDVFGCL